MIRMSRHTFRIGDFKVGNFSGTQIILNPHCANDLNELSLKVKVGTKLLLF